MEFHDPIMHSVVPFKAQPKVETHNYRGHRIILRFMPGTSQWSWEAEFTTKITFSGTTGQQSTAMKLARAKIDELSGGET